MPVFEREQRISDAPVKKCPACGALKARRQISRTSFVLKGGGWYSDLYGSKPAKSETGESKSAEAKPAEGAADKPASESPGAAAGAKAEAPPGKGSKKGGKGAKSAA
jgi:putative FmdB family regulatory protein